MKIAIFRWLEIKGSNALLCQAQQKKTILFVFILVSLNVSLDAIKLWKMIFSTNDFAYTNDVVFSIKMFRRKNSVLSELEQIFICFLAINRYLERTRLPVLLFYLFLFIFFFRLKLSSQLNTSTRREKKNGWIDKKKVYNSTVTAHISICYNFCFRWQNILTKDNI